MSVLHLINHTRRGNESFVRCLNSLAEGDGLLLIGDGVYTALRGALRQDELRALAATRVFVLEPDLVARALSGKRLAEGFQRVDFNAFVDLVAEYDASVSWG